MTYFVYDGSFDGLLCVCHAIYRSGELPDDVRVYDAGHTFFMGEVTRIRTEADHARSVAQALARYGDRNVTGRMERAFRSEEPGIERILLRYMIALLGRPTRAEASFPEVRPDQIVQGMHLVDRLARQVDREVHRMHAFVRFRRGHDGCFTADIEPVFDVVDLLEPHFRTRYPAQRWTIRDLRRGKALAYDGEATSVVPLTALPAELPPADEEEAAQSGWRTYFHAVDIPERRNPRLQRRQVPLRYRRHMSELRPSPPRLGKRTDE